MARTYRYLDVPVTHDKVNFIQPMLLLPVETLPKGAGWTYELKLDAFRAIAVKAGGEVRLRSQDGQGQSKGNFLRL